MTNVGFCFEEVSSEKCKHLQCRPSTAYGARHVCKVKNDKAVIVGSRAGEPYTLPTGA